MNVNETVLLARQKGTVIPAFNIPYLPMVAPVAKAVADENSLAIIHVARVEWEKFSAKSLESVAEEYGKHRKAGHTFLGLDHVPAIDEDQKEVDYISIIKRAVVAGFESVMIDGSRLDLEKNILVTREVAELVHGHNIACEGELGAVMGHESGPIKPYEEIFANRLGFTDIDEAVRFSKESLCDWMSVAVGNIHGAVAEATRHQKKPEARLDVDHIAALYRAAGLPLVLHGGSGIQLDYIRKGIKAGIAKINVGTEIRQTYEKAMEQKNDTGFACEAVYVRVCQLIGDMEIKNSSSLLHGK
ncbi:MAG: class II fructose-bisphosphate aldolase [Treponema sp.]|nr:class II fructose-bisphosphate aldolase [Treponema sp.]